jgi:hypothetical protein
LSGITQQNPVAAQILIDPTDILQAFLASSKDILSRSKSSALSLRGGEEKKLMA